MKVKIFIVIVACFFSLILIWPKEKDLVATTEDGRKVLLKTDGTWEFIKAQSISEWKEVVRWKGKGIKKTEPFSITSKEWRIRWATAPGDYGDGVFQIMVYKEGSEFPDIVANVMGKDEDSSYMSGSGRYRLTINTTQPYIVVIERRFK